VLALLGRTAKYPLFWAAGGLSQITGRGLQIGLFCAG
jgi:hypothetical protein